jgi:hypothetical protein
VDAVTNILLGSQELHDLALSFAQMRVLVNRTLILVRICGLITTECYALHGLATASTSTRLQGMSVAITKEHKKQAHRSARILHRDIDGLKHVENQLMWVVDRLDMGEVEIFFGPKLFERSGYSRVHVFPGLLINLKFGWSRKVNPRNTVCFPLIALYRRIHPVPTFDPSSAIPKFENIIGRVYLNAQDMGDGCNLAHSAVNNRLL